LQDIYDRLLGATMPEHLPATGPHKLRDWGIEEVLGLHQNDRGARDLNGVKMTDDWPPGAPQGLRCARGSPMAYPRELHQ